MAVDDPGVLVHDWHIDAREYARHEARRGRRHAYERLDPRRTALVVVDLVRFFTDNPYVRGAVPRAEALARGVRQAGGTVAWVLPAAPGTGGAAWAEEFYGPQVAAAYGASGGTGSPTDRLADGLTVAAADLVVEKSASSAFFPGRCSLPDLLAARGVDTVLIAGTVTSVCCAASARDAGTLGYRVVTVADACADVSDAAHNAALRVAYRSYGDVRPASEVLGLLADGPAP